MAAVNKEAILSKNLTIDQFLGLFLYSDATESESFDVPRSEEGENFVQQAIQYNNCCYC